MAAEPTPEGKAKLQAQLQSAESNAAAQAEFRPVPPNVTLRSELTLHRGSREIQVRFLGRGHTGGDVVVFLPNEKIVITGDFLTSTLSNMSDAYVDEWVTSLDALKKLDFDTVVPGHGDAFTDKAKIDYFQAYLRDVWTEVGRLKRAGVSAEAAAKQADLTRAPRPLPGHHGAWRAPHRRDADLRDDGRGQPAGSGVTTDDAPLVCVTGATGFVASCLVADLLGRGYRVRGTVRDRAKASRVAALPGAAERLTMVEAELQAPATLQAAVEGCATVFHTASPYVLNVADPQRDLVDPAVQGTINVLAACAAVGGVRRVVLTSSIAAVTDEPESDHVLTEADWNTKSTLDRNPYYLSKTLAERAAWDFMAAEKPLVRPGGDQPVRGDGPVAQSRPSTSRTRSSWTWCPARIPRSLSLTWGIVDVRDVALAHVRAAEVPEASGRYLCAAPAGDDAPGGDVDARGGLRRRHAPAHARPRQLVRQPARQARLLPPADGHGQLPEDAHRPDTPIRHREGAAGSGPAVPADARDDPRHPGGSGPLGPRGRVAPSTTEKRGTLVPMSSFTPRSPSPSAVSEPSEAPNTTFTDEVREAADLLERIAADRRVLDQLPPADRVRILRAVAQAHAPDRVQRRRASAAARFARVERDESVRADTGIRALRTPARRDHAQRLRAAGVPAARRARRAAATTCARSWSRRTATSASRTTRRSTTSTTSSARRARS